MNKSIKINYAVCNYVPNVIRQESIIFGIVIHCPSQEFSQFYRIKNIRRLKAFDDEYDPDFIDMMSETFNYYFKYPQLDFEDYEDDRFENILNDNFIPNITKYYVNEFKFSEVHEVMTTKQDLDIDIEDLIRTYLYYDKPKSERITTPEIKRLLNKELRNLDLKEKIKIPNVVDLANNKIVDYEYGDTIIKTLSFDYKKKKDIVNQIKYLESDIINNEDYFESKKIKLIVSNNSYKDEEFMSNVHTKIKGINSNIEIIPLGEYTNKLVFEGLK